MLKKSLYGLKQGPSKWYLQFESSMIDIGFVRSSYDPCFYFVALSGVSVYVLLNVDEMLLISKSDKKITGLKKKLKLH